MLIKYFFQEGHQFHHDLMSGMVIPDVKQFQFFKNGILSLLQEDKVNIEKIESLKYWNKFHEGWVEVSDKTFLDFSKEEVKELNLMIKLKEDFPCVANDLQLHFNTLINRVKSLETRLKELDSKLKNSSGILYQQHSYHILNTPSSTDIAELTRNISMYPNSVNSFEDSRLDIAFLYSNPLVKEAENGKLIPLNEPIDFESEINCLVDILQNSEKKITARFEVANLDNISEIIRKKPKILHISSHGAYGVNKKGENKFYLNFEDHQGKLDQFDAERLSNLLKSSSDEKSQIEVVFVSACHSEAVANVFREAKVPAVICVHSANEVLDEAAQKFAKIFYQCLLDGKDLKYSFEQARRVVGSGIDKTVDTCCCTHTHTPECRWQEKATKNCEEAHQMHLKRCNCNYKESHMHINNCSWALNLSGSYSFESLIEGNFMKICCCSPEVAHNESNKFMMKIDNKFENESIFLNIPSGNLEIKNKNCCLNTNFTVEMKTSLIGRNVELYNVISILSAKNSNNKRLVTVHGQEGVGKNSFVKLAGKYMFERKFFQDGVIYINTRGHVFTESWFISKIIANLDLDNIIDDILHFCNLIKQLRILIIVNFSKQNEDSVKEIKKTLKTILDHTRTPKFVVTLDNPLNIEPYENKTKLEPLCCHFSAKLLMTLANNYLPSVIKNDIEKIRKHEFIQISQGIPSKIYHIAGMLQEHKTFEALIDRIKKEDFKKQALSDQLVKILLDNMSKNSILIYEILFLLSVLPNGILEEELVEIYKKYNNYLEIFDIIDHISNNTIVIVKSINKEIGTSYSLAYDLINSIYSLNIDHAVKLKCYKDVVKYYAKLMRNLVMNIYDNQECPTEFSAAQNFGIWVSLNKNICVIPNKTEKVKWPLKRYFFNETNILSMLKIDNIYLKELLESKNDEFIESIEQLSICMPTVLKLGKKMTECVTVYNFFLKICEEYHLSLAQARLFLFKASLHSLYSSNQNNNYSLFHYRNNIYTDSNRNGNIFANLIDAKKIFDSKNFEEGDAETSFVKGVILYEIESSRSRYSFERIARENFETIIKELDNAIKIYRRIQHTTGLARVSYIMAQYSINNRQYEESAIKNFKEALTIFEKNNNKILQIKCLQGMGLWYLGIQNLVASKDYLEQAKIIADKLKTSNNEVIKYELNKQITELLDHSRARSHNVFVFVKASQLIKFDINSEMNFSRSKSVERFLSSTYKEIEYPVDPMVIHYSTFRDRIKEKFNKTKKEITIKFDFLTEKNLKDIFSRVGRVLHVSSDEFNSKGSLFVESDDGESYELTPEHLRHIITKTKCLYDLVILAIPQSENLAKIFVESGIRHVICFRFNELFLKKSENLPSISFYNIIHEFTISILNSIIIEQTVEDAYRNAVREFNKQIANVRHHLFNFNLNKEVISDPAESNQVAEVLLLPAEINHKVKLYGKSIDSENDETILLDGKLHDASNVRARLFNIVRRKHAMIGRKKEIYNGSKMIKMINMFNIFGDSGCGKTFLAKEICYYLYTRNYFKEGIFYFDLLEVRNVEKIKALFHEASVSSAIEEAKKLKGDGRNQDEERKILIVFDNVDKMLKYTENQFFLYLKSYNKERIFVHFILISNKEIHNDNVIESMEVTHLPSLEASYVFLYYLNRPIDPKEIDIDKNEIEAAGDYKLLIERVTDLSELIGLSTRLRACRGMPKYIKKLAELATTKLLTNINLKELNLSRKLLNTNNSDQNSSHASIKRDNVRHNTTKELSKDKYKHLKSNNQDEFRQQPNQSLIMYQKQTSSRLIEHENSEFLLDTDTKNVINKNSLHNEKEQGESSIKSSIGSSNNFSEKLKTNDDFMKESLNSSTGQGINIQKTNFFPPQTQFIQMSSRNNDDHLSNKSQNENSLHILNNSFIRSSLQSNNTYVTNQTNQTNQNVVNLPFPGINNNLYISENLQNVNSKENSQLNIGAFNNIIMQNKNRVSFGRASFTVGSSLSNTNFNNFYNTGNILPQNQLGGNHHMSYNNTISSLNNSIIFEDNNNKINTGNNKNELRNSLTSNTSLSVSNTNRVEMKKRQSDIAEEDAEEDVERKFSNQISFAKINLIKSNEEENENSENSGNHKIEDENNLTDSENTPDEEEDPFINNQTLSPDSRFSKVNNDILRNKTNIELNSDVNPYKTIKNSSNNSQAADTNKLNNNSFFSNFPINNFNNSNNNPTFQKNFFNKDILNKMKKNSLKANAESGDANSNSLNKNYLITHKTYNKKNSSQNKKQKQKNNSNSPNPLVIKNIYIPQYAYDEQYDINKINKTNTNIILDNGSQNSHKKNTDIQNHSEENPFKSNTQNFQNNPTQSPFDNKLQFSPNSDEESSSMSDQIESEFEHLESTNKTIKSKNSLDRTSSLNTISQSGSNSFNKNSNYNNNQNKKKKKKGVKSGKMYNKFKPKNNNKYLQGFKKKNKKDDISEEE